MKIRTTKIKATDTLGERIRVRMMEPPFLSQTMPYDFSAQDAHEAAAREFARGQGYRDVAFVRGYNQGNVYYAVGEDE